MIICHQPVFIDYILEYLVRKNDRVIADFTLGEGGHTLEFLNLNKMVWGIDRDAHILSKVRDRLKNHPHYSNLTIVNQNYCEMEGILKENQIKLDFALFDLGISKFHYQESQRGFSFMKDEPLDMRLNVNQTINAGSMINRYGETQLADLFYQYGEERYSKLCAKVIIEKRKQNPITMTFQLADLIKEVYQRKRVRSKIHPATKIFQALRIAVNQELEQLESGLQGVINRLNSGGRLAVISYHSLEDRIVKNLFKKIGKKNETYNKYREEKKESPFWLHRPKVIKPSREEILTNPSSRSAKMRVLGRT